jgi:hypothetical protein
VPVLALLSPLWQGGEKTVGIVGEKTPELGLPATRTWYSSTREGVTMNSIVQWSIPLVSGPSKYQKGTFYIL